MNSIQEFSFSIRKLVKEKMYADALKFFKENKHSFSKEDIVSNFYIVSDMINSMRFQMQHDAAYKFLNIYGVKIDNNTNKQILSSYGWLLYSNFKAQLTDSKDKLSEVTEDFLEEEQNDNQIEDYDRSDLFSRIIIFIPIAIATKDKYCYSAFSNLFNLMLKSEKVKINTNWRKINDLCDLVSPGDLSKENSTIKQTVGNIEKTIELASDFEQWYTYKTAALFRLSEFEECIQLSEIALKSISHFHYSNDIWFKRKIGMSAYYLGEPEKAKEIMERLILKKREWFMQQELANICIALKDNNMALKYAIDAINNFGEISKKVSLLSLIADILLFEEITEEKRELAHKHYLLSCILRKKNGWKEQSSIINKLQKSGYGDIDVNNYQEIYKELKKYWESFKNLRKGFVEKILNDNEKGVNGFIRYDSPDNIYFLVSSKDLISKKIEVGSKLSFEIFTDTTTNKSKATNIKLLKSS